METINTPTRIPITMKSFDVKLQTKPDTDFPSFYHSSYYNDGDYPISNLKVLSQRIQDDIMNVVDSVWLAYHIDHASRQIFNCNRLSQLAPIDERDNFVRNLHLIYEIKQYKYEYFMENGNKVVAMLLNQIVEGLIENDYTQVQNGLYKINLFY
jgi:hypothetical protein